MREVDDVVFDDLENAIGKQECACQKQSAIFQKGFHFCPNVGAQKVVHVT